MYRHVPIWQHNASPISMNDLYSIFCQNALSIYVYPWGMHCRVVYDSGVTPVRPSEGAVVMPAHTMMSLVFPWVEAATLVHFLTERSTQGKYVPAY